MSPASTPSNRDEIVAQLFRLFRCGGYEGVSVGDVSKATGLGKSSLYHYFPGGKADMATAVVSFARDWIKAHIVDPLGDAGVPLDARIDAMLTAARDLYDGGTSPCLVASMLVTPDGTTPEGNAGVILSDWIEALSKALQANGVDAAEADARAIAALVRIEGSLLVARATGNLAVFETALEETRNALIEK